MTLATRTARKRAKKLSRTHKPAELSVHEWQRALREQFAPEAGLSIQNQTAEPVFSEFRVFNPASQRAYRVVIRGETPGRNYCSCPDYAVNTLGTCKHIEAVLHRLRRRHSRALRAGWQPPFSEVYVQYGECRQVRFAAAQDCPEALRRLARRHFDADGVLLPDAPRHWDQFISEARRTGHELRVYDDALARIAELRDDELRQARLAARYEGRGAQAAWNGLLKTELLPYQRTGALFAARAGRALIADEMGLGKTIQAIAAAELLAREFGLERALVVCPTSLKAQWQREIERFSQRSALVIQGPLHERARQLRDGDGAFFKIVNYDVIHRDFDAIADWSPELVILDEAQRIKNWQTRAARTVKQIQSRYALVLTGTPLENRIEELHSIVEFVDRHRLGPLFAFKAAHEMIEPEGTRVVGYRDLDRINQTLAPVLIRRTKKEVLSQLPPRMDKNFFVPMTPPQWNHHDENRVTVAKLVAKWRRYRFLTDADQLRLRIALQNMRMACDSTYLLDKETRHQTKIDELDRLLSEIFEQPDAKAVIFSQWVRMNELVAERLDDRGWRHVHLHGGVPGRDRAELVRALREDADCRVFLSTDAGGVGLNLQEAAVVINVDLPWNPAVLEQRIGRVHRMGQKRPVRVVNFVSEGTIEHGMLSLLSFKRSVFAGVLDGTENEVFMGESAMSRFMKTVETATQTVPQADRAAETEYSSAAPSDDAAARGELSGGDVLGSGASGAAPVAGAAPGKPGEIAALVARTPSAPAARVSGAPASGAPALGELLLHGAELLATFGRVLAGGAAAAGERTDARGAPESIRIETDARTGRREMRLALPQDEVLQAWLGRIQAALGTLRSLT